VLLNSTKISGKLMNVKNNMIMQKTPPYIVGFIPIPLLIVHYLLLSTFFSRTFHLFGLGQKLQVQRGHGRKNNV